MSTVISTAPMTHTSVIATTTSQRYRYSHLLVLYESSAPHPSLPVAKRILHQTHVDAPIISFPENDSFVTKIHFGVESHTHNDEKNNEEDSTAAATQLLLSTFADAMTDMRSIIKAECGVKSQVTPIGNGNGAVREWRIDHNDGGRDVLLQHTIIKRPAANPNKVAEATTRVNYTKSKNADIVRLDHLAMDEATFPATAFQLGQRSSMTQVQLSHSNFITLPPQFWNAFANITQLNLSNNEFLRTLPNDIASLVKLTHLALTDCKNLQSLPQSLVLLKPTLQEIDLYGCVALTYPPHAVAVKCGLATQLEHSRAGVVAMLDYMNDPLSFLSFSLSAAKRALNASASVLVYPPLSIAVRDVRLAFGFAGLSQYAEYEVVCQCNSVEWSVWRRYSQFKALYDAAVDELPKYMSGFLPSMPDRTFSAHCIDDETTADRRLRLDAIMRVISDFDVRNERKRRNEKNGNADEACKSSRALSEIDVFAEFVEYAQHKNQIKA